METVECSEGCDNHIMVYHCKNCNKTPTKNCWKFHSLAIQIVKELHKIFLG